MFCPECGKEISDISKFCKSCGNHIEGDTIEETQTPISNDRPTPTPTPNSKTPQKKPVESILSNIQKHPISFGIIILICGVLLYSIFSSGRSGDRTSQSTPPPDPIQVLSETPPSDLQPEGELYEMYILGSDYTDVQRENKEREITGEIVQWTLPVYEVHRKDYGYEISTSRSKGDLFNTRHYVSTECHLSPRSSSERQYIESLKTGDMVEIKGKIKGVTTFIDRWIVIDPCILPGFRQEEKEIPISKEQMGQVDMSKCLKSEPETVILSGKLEKVTYPFTTNTGRVEKETGFYLSLNDPVCYKGDDLSGPKQNILLIQLVLDKKGYGKLRPYLGKNIKLKGSLFGSHTGHHHTPILLDNVVLTESVISQEYVEYCNKRYGFCVKYPSNFKLKSSPENIDGQGFYDDKGFSMSVSGINNFGDNLENQIHFQSKNFETITYQTKKNNWFVLSGYKSSNILYLKTYVGKSSINNLYIQFPSNQKNEYNDIVTKISKSFKSGNLNESH